MAALDVDKQWLHMALQVAAHVAVNARDLRSLRWQILEISRNRFGANFGTQHFDPDVDIQKAIDILEPLCGSQGKKPHVEECIKMLIGKGQRTLATRLEVVSSTSAFIAHPDPELLSELRDFAGTCKDDCATLPTLEANMLDDDEGSTTGSDVSYSNGACAQLDSTLEDLPDLDTSIDDVVMKASIVKEVATESFGEHSDDDSVVTVIYENDFGQQQEIHPIVAQRDNILQDDALKATFRRALENYYMENWNDSLRDVEQVIISLPYPQNQDAVELKQRIQARILDQMTRKLKNDMSSFLSRASDKSCRA